MNLNEWLDAAAASAKEIARGPLGATTTSWSSSPAMVLPDDLCGVYIPLSSDGLALQIGVLAERATCAKLAKSLLGIGHDEPLGSDEDVFDALGEITNMVAGGVKVRLAEKTKVTVGLPLAMKGKLIQLGGSLSIHGSIRIDDSSVWLVVTGTVRRKA